MQRSKIFNGLNLEKTLIQIKKWKFWQNKLIILILLISLFINLFAYIYIFAKYSRTSVSIPLHYSPISGIDLLGPWQNLLKIPFSGLIFFLFNTISAFLFYGEEKIISYILIFSLLFFEFLLVFSIFLIAKL